MAVCFRETRVTIDLLRRVVDKLDKNNGCIKAEELWDGVQCEPANIRSSDPTVARHGIRQMEALLDGLQSFASTLTSTFKSHISATRSRARIPHLTLHSLPAEIIDHIMKDTIGHYDHTIMNDTFNDNRDRPLWLIKYSHICSRIRNIILDSPSLWASIPLTLKMPTDLIVTIIRRSAALKFIVDIHIRGRNSKLYTTSRWQMRAKPLSSSSVLSRLSTMFEHQHRWKEVTITVYNESKNFIQEHFPRANLTSVDVLGIDSEGLGTDFFPKWEIPLLEILDWQSTDVFPPPHITSQRLRICSLWLGPDASTLTSIAAFLNAATGLRSLKLCLDFRPGTNDGLQETRLSHLEHLEVSFGCNSWTSIATPFLKAILCPGLKHLSLRINAPDDYFDLTEGIEGRYPELTSFKLSIAAHFRRKVIFFEDILCPLPGTIKNLQVELEGERGRNAILRASRREDIVPHELCPSYPNLTDLVLEGYTIREESFYTNLSEILSHFRVSLNHFQPGEGNELDEIEIQKNAIMALRRAGVLVDLTLTT